MQLPDLKDRVALITGGSRGLGATIGRHLAANGAHIAFTYSNDAASAKSLEKEIGGKTVGLRANAADFTRAQEVVEEVTRRLGDIDILVCSAGIARSAPIVRMTEEDWDVAVDISLKGTFNYIRAVAPGFVKRNRGKIVCIGSINGLRGRIGTASYNAAKAGLTGLVKTAAAELGANNVNVNLVAPGFVETTSQTSTPELIRDLVMKECAIKRLGTPDDIAPVVAFLCSDAARHVTGQTIKVDAGQYL
jgi:3-oxoacyl-[acyl-carrier protein] reductase